jgi:hypothetical protein
MEKSSLCTVTGLDSVLSHWSTQYINRALPIFSLKYELKEQSHTLNIHQVNMKGEVLN